MDEFKRSRMEYAFNAAIGFTTASIGIFMSITAFFPFNKGLLLSGLAFIALGLGYGYLAMEKIITFKLNAIHQYLALENRGRINRFDIISSIFKWLGKIMYYAGMILLVLITFKYMSYAYLDISIGLEGVGLTVLSVGTLYGMNNKFDNIGKGIYDLDKNFKKN
ncbi:MAG: hypothetical protein MUO97_07590 [Dehalococcoidia bacterium]|nr:hypothetical protein [Dehalococcoidia bacterium]